MFTREKALFEGHEKGLEKGRKEGRKEGLIEGHEEEKIAIARKMIEMGLELNFISEATGLTEKEIFCNFAGSKGKPTDASKK